MNSVKKKKQLFSETLSDQEVRLSEKRQKRKNMWPAQNPGKDATQEDLQTGPFATAVTVGAIASAEVNAF